MKKILFTLIILFSSLVYSQNIIEKNIESYELNTTRKIQIYIPDSYQQDTLRSYPLAVILDGNLLFDTYVGNARLFSKSDKAPEQIIVGINQDNPTQRQIDCSYEASNNLPTSDGDNFYRFIRGELLDYMELNYRVSPFKTIVGNKLTGNFLNYFLIEDTPGFNAFICINPDFAPEIAGYLSAKGQKIKEETFYYLATGDYDSKKKQTEITYVSDFLSQVQNKKFNYKFQYFENITTTTSLGQSIPQALSFIFDIYSAVSEGEFAKKLKDLTPVEAIAYLETKYVEIDYLFGSDLKIREKDIYAIESIVIEKENGDYLKDFGKMLNKLYEESPLGNYYLGMYYEKKNKLKKALRYYKDGYMKVPNDHESAVGYYRNVERVLEKMDAKGFDTEEFMDANEFDTEEDSEEDTESGEDSNSEEENTEEESSDE
ncbi:alpha/beta hydrolase [Aureivirga marina]|uniref:alpha/beta hydrolase n=1 Tax=Aureivirga marina TaxID=1182451 RepID=UPI0018CA44D9|nr:alpha/beta hydrolase-fold protein [Aureivirga marina]